MSSHDLLCGAKIFRIYQEQTTLQSTLQGNGDSHISFSSKAEMSGIKETNNNNNNYNNNNY